jgi:hypothetical protein
VQEDCACYSYTQQPVARSNEQERNEEKENDKAERVENRSATPKNCGEQQPEGFVNEIRDHRRGNTYRDRPTVIRQVPEDQTKKSTGEHMGEDEHFRYALIVISK